MKPIVALVGRPNVGKSTLFNRLTRSRTALVADVPGLTRDRQYGDGRVGDRPYHVVDTGGLVEGLRDGLGAGMADQIAIQVRQAVTEADVIVFVMDARAGVAPADLQIAADLRRTGKPVSVAVNKAEGVAPDIAVSEFHALGLGAPFAVSAAHGDGVEELMRHVLAPLAVVDEEHAPDDLPRIAVLGRPNAGKSTLVNAMLGETRVLVSDEAGTTRDSIRIPLEYRERHYVLIDTAGVRRRHRINDQVEQYSVVKSLQAVDEANVVLLVVDAQVGIGEQEATLGGYVIERGRSLVVVVNKWEALDGGARDWLKRELDRKLTFLEFAKIHFISALKGEGVEGLFGSIDRAFESANRTLPTPKLNRVLQAAVQATPPPVVHGRRIRLKYAHQGGKNPPTVVIHGNQAPALPKSYRRYLANAFRSAFDLVRTPVRIKCRQGENPFAGARARD
jgi:GTP-binding protein